MKSKQVLSGHILPTVLVIGTLMLLAVQALLMLMDTGNRLAYELLVRRQKEAWLESALLLYEQDSTLTARLDESRNFRLFDQEPESEITLWEERWGLYELIRVKTESYRRAQLTGYACESAENAALYLPDNLRAVTLAGKSRIEGPVYLPPSGILYGQVQSNFFHGKPVAEKNIRISASRLPMPESRTLDSLRALQDGFRDLSRPENAQVRQSFFEPTVYLCCGNLSGHSLRGNVVVYADQTVEIDSTSRLEDIILVAPKVIIGPGFTGSLQILATDSVRIAEQVTLSYPSGIAVPRAADHSCIEIGPGSRVNGYVILRTEDRISPEQRTPHFLQHPGSRTRGLIWIDGIAQVQGIVTGSLYATELNYYTSQGYYVNLLYGLSVYRSQAMAFPLWMKSEYRRKGIKWVD
ncbi:MAG: hypothetical protein LUD68_00820 [Rikenellaceae bacterium]|nr:hypothetical protein [Rikenellaceae bacterium]